MTSRATRTVYRPHPSDRPGAAFPRSAAAANSRPGPLLLLVQGSSGDEYVAAVQLASAANAGRWIEVPRRFRAESNANMTATCLRGGYLRVEAQEGDTPVYVAGKRYLKTPVPVSAHVERGAEGWLVRVQA